MSANLIDAGVLWIEIKKEFLLIYYNLSVLASRTITTLIAEANKIVANVESVKSSSKPTDPIKQRSRKFRVRHSLKRTT